MAWAAIPEASRAAAPLEARGLFIIAASDAIALIGGESRAPAVQCAYQHLRRGERSEIIFLNGVNAGLDWRYQRQCFAAVRRVQCHTAPSKAFGSPRFCPSPAS
jgi:hypothetical protein